jgi:hypothetical protein
MKPFDNPDTSEGFGQASRDFGIDLPALPEDGANGLEGPLENHSKDQKESQGNGRQRGVDANQEDKRDYRRKDAANEFDETGPHQIPHALHIRHDPGDQGASLVRIVIADGKASDVRLDANAHFRNQLLR